jgi:hypothetical protein
VPATAQTAPVIMELRFDASVPNLDTREVLRSSHVQRITLNPDNTVSQTGRSLVHGPGPAQAATGQPLNASPGGPAVTDSQIRNEWRVVGRERLQRVSEAEFDTQTLVIRIGKGSTCSASFQHRFKPGHSFLGFRAPNGATYRFWVDAIPRPDLHGSVVLETGTGWTTTPSHSNMSSS